MNRGGSRITLMIVAAVLLAAMTPLLRGQTKSRRAAMGDERAAEVETLLTTISSGATVVWDPELAIRAGSQLIPVDMEEFKVTPQADGSLWGVAAFELGPSKKDYLSQLKKFQPVNSQSFPTTLVVFRTNSSRRTITAWKKFDLTPSGQLSRVQVLHVQNWTAAQWPVVSVQYTSYFPSGDSLTAIEWYSRFDTNTGSFRSRMPAGLIITQKDGSSATEIFSIRRFDSSNLEIQGEIAKKEITYPCADPCVVDGTKFLSQWGQ